MARIVEHNYGRAAGTFWKEISLKMSIEKQMEILRKITKIMHTPRRGGYDEMRCEFDYEAYEGGWSVRSKYSLVRGGVLVSDFLDDLKDTSSDLVHQLHELMKSHTGGDWKSFVLSVDSSGKANTKFVY